MKATDVIRRPLVTEKTTILREDGRTLVLQVAADANKVQIRRAVETLFGSKVADATRAVRERENDLAPFGIAERIEREVGERHRGIA